MSRTPVTFTYKTLPSGLELCLDVYLPPSPAVSSGEAPQALAILQWMHGGGLFFANRTGIAQHVKEAVRHPPRAGCPAPCFLAASDFSRRKVNVSPDFA